MEKPKWKERMTEGEIESLYEYELEKGIINMPNAPYYESFNEFLEMAMDQVEVITEEEKVEGLVKEVLKEMGVEKRIIPEETYENILIRSFDEPVYFKPEKEQIKEIVKCELEYIGVI